MNWNKSDFFANFAVLYRYMPIAAFEATLDSWALKATLSYEANDPLELTPQFDSESESYTAIAYTNKPEHDSPPFICFSRLTSSPAMWGHYADSGRGVCLVFLFPIGMHAKAWRSGKSDENKVLLSYLKGIHDKGDNYFFQLRIPPLYRGNYVESLQKYYLAPIEYSEERVQSKNEFLKGNNKRAEEWSHRLVTTKAYSWHYEEEIRMVCNLPQSDKIEKGKILYSCPMDFLAGVIAGPCCCYSNGLLHQKLILAYEKAEKGGARNYFIDRVPTLFRYGFFVDRAYYHVSKFQIQVDLFPDRLTSLEAFRNMTRHLFAISDKNPIDTVALKAIFPDVAREAERGTTPEQEA